MNRPRRENVTPLTPGSCLQKLIVQKKREVAARHNDAGLIAMWPQAVKEVLIQFPNLSGTERAALRANVQGQIKLLCTRTRKSFHDFTPALEAVARLLGSAQ